MAFLKLVREMWNYLRARNQQSPVPLLHVTKETTHRGITSSWRRTYLFCMLFDDWWKMIPYTWKLWKLSALEKQLHNLFPPGRSFHNTPWTLLKYNTDHKNKYILLTHNKYPIRCNQLRCHFLLFQLSLNKLFTTKELFHNSCCRLLKGILLK